MSEHPIWSVGNRNPSITEVIVDSALAPIDLNSPASTVQFRARIVDTPALIVDQAAVIVQTGSGGTAVDKGAVRYDWSAADVAANGALADAHDLLVWWRVTTGGKTQDLMEAIVEVRAHAPQARSYVELEEFKSTLTMSGTTFADGDMQRVLVASARAVDKIAHRRFYADADANQIRYYSPKSGRTFEIDDLVTLTSVVSDYDGDGTFEQTWVENTDFTLEPMNAVADGRPWETIRRHPRSSFYFSPYPRSLKVTGKFGWAAVPDGAKVATSQIAARVLTILRQAPLGVASVGIDGVAIRVSREMPEVTLALGDLIRDQVLA